MVGRIRGTCVLNWEWKRVGVTQGESGQSIEELDLTSTDTGMSELEICSIRVDWWRHHPRTHITHCTVVRQHAHKIWWNLDIWFMRYGRRQADRQMDTLNAILCTPTEDKVIVWVHYINRHSAYSTPCNNTGDILELVRLENFSVVHDLGLVSWT